MAVEYHALSDGDRAYDFGLYGIDAEHELPGWVEESTDGSGNPTLILIGSAFPRKGIMISLMEAHDLLPLLKHFAETGRLPEPTEGG